MNENRYLEYKETITNTFLKTVSAFSNFGTGRIVFGVKDDGSIVGLSDIENAKLDLENKINDSISPKPDYHFEVSNKGKTLTLIVEEGEYKPYLYKGKAYRRADTASIEVDRVELARLTLEGQNLYFDQLHGNKQELEFSILQKKAAYLWGVEEITQDILKTLGLLNNKGYTKAAELLADENNFSGIDIVRFGADEDEIRDRLSCQGVSVLKQLDSAVEMYYRYYVVEQIAGMERKRKELIPENAFREAVANALIHRTWDVNSNIRIGMYDDKIEIMSPGGLMSSISREEYMNGRLSVLRNPVIATVFFRLHYVEMFGTGIKKIQRAYKESIVKPDFEIMDNSIKITLPVLNMTKFTTDENEILNILGDNLILSTSEIVELSGFSKNKVLRILNALADKKCVTMIGNGRGRKYKRDSSY